ncbi:MAG: drug/metabolite transporter (DMT)-like permease [Bacteroidia bacterium]|jgi:drug/metabolite transporter (DMT)-like permease
MKEHKSWLPYLLLAILAIIWGSSFILMKEGLKVMTSIQMAAYRISVCGLVFFPFVLKHFKRIEPKDRKYALLAGLIGSGIPAFLFATSQKHINSSLAGILNALTPVFTVLIAVVFTKLILSKNKVFGVVIGFIGAMAIIIGKMVNAGESDINIESSQVQYVLMIVLATFLYGANINLIKNKLAKYNAFVIASTPLFMISIIAMIIMAFTDWSNIQEFQQSQVIRSFTAITVLAIFGTSLSLILFNRLVQTSGPVFASSVTYFIPFVAVFLGLLDGETVLGVQILGMGLILTGVYLINRRIKTPVADLTD